MRKLFISTLIKLLVVICFPGCQIDGSSGYPDHNSTNDNISKTPQFSDDFNADAVNDEIWQVATWWEHGGKTGRDRCYTKDGYLNMEFINDSSSGSFLGSAIQTWDTFLYGRWEARLKPSSVSGVLNSMYTIDWGDGNGTKQEIDIEFLTYYFSDNAGKVHYAVHAEGLSSYNTNPDVELDFNPSENFHIWGFEITPEYIEWFVDDQVLLRYTYNDTGNEIRISSPYQLKFNFWSSSHWVMGPPEKDKRCLYLIDWIRFYPYNE